MKRQVLTGSKLCATVLSMLLAFHPVFPVFAQAQAPELKVAIFRDLVRFAAPSDVQEMRVEMFNSTGEKIYDSNFVAGQTQDWLLQNLQGQTVVSGLYAYSITVKDKAGIVMQVQRGNVIVDQERGGLESAPPIDRSQTKPFENQPQPNLGWDVEHGKNPYVINTPAMGVGTQNPLTRLHIGAGAVEPVTKGSTLLLEEGAATGMVLKSTTGAEMFFSQDKKYGLFGTASNHPLGIRTNNQNRLWVSNEGNVGIGTTNPGSPLTVAGTIEMTSGGIKFPDGTIQNTAASGGSDISDGATAGPSQKNGRGPDSKKGTKPAGADGDWSLTGNSGTDSATNFLGTTDNKPLIFKVNTPVYMFEAMRIDTTGNIGIGTTMPAARLHSVIGPDTNPNIGANIKSAVKGVANVEFGIGVFGATTIEKGAGVLGQGAGENSVGVRGENNGGHGIVGASTGKGTAGVLGFSGDSIGVEGFTFTGTALYGHSGDGNAASMKNDSSSHATTALRNAGSGDVLIMQANGGSFIRAVNNAGDKTLFSVSSDGTTITNVLQINGGADLSEKFEVKAPLDIDSNVLSQEVHPGMIVVIDPDNSGKLVVSSQSYDRKVAGIISGAGGIKPGMLMSQSSSVADGSHPVALTGRVYCWADASNSPIYPGDLLTTSKIPGHAMKVCNYEKAQGAIIGKAMTGLKSGRGLVLVLVTLQ